MTAPVDPSSPRPPAGAGTVPGGADAAAESGGAPSTAPAPRSAWRERLEFAAKSFLWAAFLGSLVAGGLRLRMNSRAAPEHVVDLLRWRVVERPSWTTMDDVLAVRDASAMEAIGSAESVGSELSTAAAGTGGVAPIGGRISLFDRTALASVETSLGAAPGVRRVLSIHRETPDRLVATLELRRPVVAVEIPGADGAPPTYVEADRDGVALRVGLRSRPVRAARPLPLVVGAMPVRTTGKSFGADVQAAAALVLRFLRAAHHAAGTTEAASAGAAVELARVDVSNLGSRRSPGASAVVVWVAEKRSLLSCPIEWGRIEGFHQDVGEPAFAHKRQRLRQALTRFPGLRGLATVKVGFRDLVVVPGAESASAAPVIR